jgi:hypothetical protein
LPEAIAENRIKLEEREAQEKTRRMAGLQGNLLSGLCKVAFAASFNTLAR